MAEYKVDRTGWASGPWDDEPDKLVWKDEATGLPCMIIRAPRLGNLCGYVVVSPTHYVHTSALREHQPPNSRPMFFESEHEYRDVAYVRSECEKLAAQLAAVK